VEGAFPVEQHRGRGRAASLARRVLEGLGLVPRTLRGRARLKRLVYRTLLELPPELGHGFAPVAPRVTVPSGPVREFKVIYVIARSSGV